MTDEMTSKLSSFFSVGRKIAGAGLNYHSLLAVTKAAKPKEPVIFLKPSTAYITEGSPIVIPKGFEVNEEIELGVIIGKTCRNVDEKSAMEYVGGYCAALDMTAMSELSVARKSGLPWCIGKGFDTACPVSRFVSRDEIPDPHDVRLFCKVNGALRQEGNTDDLIFNVPSLISYISRFMTLEPNDLILTGSPPGMGPVVPGDVVEAGIRDVVTMEFTVKAE